MLPRKTFEQVRERDGHFCLMALPYCLGEGDVLHHRANRGSGGSKGLDDPRNLVLVCSICNGLAEDANGLVRADLMRRGLRVEKDSTNAKTLERCIATPVEYLDGEQHYLVSATERRHISEGRPD